MLILNEKDSAHDQKCKVIKISLSTDSVRTHRRRIWR